MQLCLGNTRHIIITTQGAHFVGRSRSHRANDLHIVLNTWGRGGVEETKQGQMPWPSYQGMLWAHVEITHHSRESLNDWSALQPFYRLLKKYPLYCSRCITEWNSCPRNASDNHWCPKCQTVLDKTLWYLLQTSSKSILNFLLGILRLLRYNLEK